MELLPSLTFGILISAITINLILTVAVFTNNPKSATHRIFSALGLVFSGLLVAVQLSTEPNSPEIALIWIRLSIFLAVPLTGLFYLISKTIPSETLTISKKKLNYILLISAFVMAVTISPFAFTSVEEGNGLANPQPGPGIIFFILYVIISTSAIAYVLITRVKVEEQTVKTQLSIVGVGILSILLLTIITIVLPVNLFRNSSFVPLFPIYSIIFTSLTAYAIVKHSLFQIKVIATEAVTVVLWVVLFSKIFVAASGAERALDSIVFIIVALFGLLLIRSVRNEVEQRVQLQALTDKLKEMDARKDEFINVAAHELRAPMTAIKGYLSMTAEGDAGKLPDKAADFINSSITANDRLIRLVNNMLNVARIEEGRLVYNMGNVNLSEVVETSFKEFEANAKEKGLEYTLSIEEGIAATVFVDIDRIHEVINNLISNAIKYTDKGSVSVKLFPTAQHTVKFEITDTGPGMSEHEQSKLFQKFYRAESNVGKAMGTGLGLYITKLLIEKFKGGLGVISQKEKGSTFWFELPVKYDSSG